MPADPETPLRADARRNRDQIIAAARDIFARQGPDVPMEEIARAAGVGVGTLYRRFSDRDALIAAVARASIAEEPTAWDALVRFLRHSQELKLSVKLAMVSPKAASVMAGEVMTDEFRDALLQELDAVVHQAQAEDVLRTDIDTGDVAMDIALLLRQLPGTNDEVARVGPDRCMSLVLDGLRAQPCAWP
jgi:AcrR family transcriptional regulator